MTNIMSGSRLWKFLTETSLTLKRRLGTLYWIAEIRSNMIWIGWDLVHRCYVITQDLVGMVPPATSMTFDRASPVPGPLPQRPTTDSVAPPNLRFRWFFATTLRAWAQWTAHWNCNIVIGYTNSTNPSLSAHRRLTCPRNECGRDKNLTDGQNIFDVFTFSKYFASFLPLISIPSQNYLSFVPQAACQQ